MCTILGASNAGEYRDLVPMACAHGSYTAVGETNNIHEKSLYKVNYCRV